VANYTWMDSPGPEHQRFVEAYKALSNGELLPGMYAANTYIATRMLVSAIEKAGDPDPEKVIPALEALEFRAPWSTVRFRKEDHQAITKAYVTEVVKTTTLRSIMGLVAVRQGTIELDGAGLVGRATHQIARRGWPTCRKGGGSSGGSPWPRTWR